jgi:Ca2+-binding RTX toxin-like protein
MPISNTSNNFMLWFAGVGGGDALAFVSGDPAVGGGNSAIALTYILNGDPNLFAPRDIVLDTVHDKFFFVDSDLAGHNRILQGSISQVLANPGAPAFTVLYQDTNSGANSALRAIVIDPEHSQIFFDHGTTFDRINYNTALQAPTVLANLGSGNFITQIAINFATGTVFLGSSRVTTFFGQDVVEDNFVYRATGLTPASATLTFSKIPFSPNDTAFGDPDVPPIGGNAFPQEHGTIRGIDYDPVSNTLYISTATVTLDTSTAQDGSELTTYYGGVFAYALTGNPTGTYTTIFQQNGVNGPVGQLGFIEVDPSTGHYFVVDVTGGPAAGDGGVWVGNLAGGTPTLFATIGNPGNLTPQGLDLIHAPTLNGVETGASAVETVGPGSGFSAAVQPFASIDAGDLDSAAFTDQLRGALVRISAGFGSAPGSNERLTIGGTTSGTLGSGIAYSYNSLTGVMTLSGVNTFDNYEAALSLVSYSIDGDNPDANGTAPTRTISFSLFDGLLFSDEFDTTVNVVDTDDAPVNTTGGAVATSEDAAAVAVTGLSVSDVDDGSLTVTLSVGRGTLTLASTAGLSFSTGDGTGDATMTFSGSTAAINAALAGLSYTPDANVNGPDSLTMTTSDGSASDVDNVSISVTAVNDAPTVAGDGTESAAPIVEDMPSPVGQTVASLFGGQYSDATDQVAGGSSADAFAGVAVTANGSGAAGQWQYYNGVSWVDIGPASDGAAVLLAAGTSIRFNPAANFNGAAPTLTVHLVDASGGALTDGAVVDASVTGGTTRYSTGTVVLDQTVTADNDNPVNTTPGAVATSEDASVAVSGLSVSDADNASLTVTLSVGRGTLTLGSVAGLSFATGDGTGDATMTFSGTTADINTALAGLNYAPNPNVNGPDTLTMSTTDGSGSDVDNVAISVSAVNDAPTVAGDGTESAAPIVEDMPSPVGQTVASLFGGQYSDAADQVPGGSSADAFAGVAVTANGSGAAGQWQYYNGSTWVNIGPASDAAAVLLSAGTSIRFNPAANFNGAAPTLTTHLVDASAGAIVSGSVVDASVTGGTTRYSTGTVVLDQTVTSDNDGPVNTTGGAVATSEDAASVAVSGLSVSDVDSSSLTVTLSVGRGTLTLGSTAGLSFGTGDGTGDATMTFSGSQAAINAALAGLTYTPTANVNGADSLTMTTSDGSASDVDNVAINVTAVNDAPTVVGDGTEDAAPILQDTPSPVGQTVASLFGGQYSDATDQVAGGSSADAFAGVAVTANGSGAAGQWQYFNGVSWVNIGAASNGAAVLLSASTSIRFNPALGFTGSAPTLTTHLVDASAGALVSGAVVDASVTGGTTRYSTGTVVLSETVIAVNTPPTGVTGTLSVQEVSANGTLVGTLTAADPDSSSFTYSLVNDAGGRFDINATTGAVTVENGLLLDYEQNASHTIRVRVDDHEGGISEFNVNVTVTDRHGELVIGDGNNHTYYGGAESDILIGGHGSDVIHGGGGIDIITGGNLLFDPTDAGDQLFGEGGNDVIDGNGGDDVIAGGADSDVLAGEEGNDIIYGGASVSDATDTGNDVISGGTGNDFLYGNGGNDQLFGDDNDDQLFGGAGADDLDGGSGIDRLNGGAGADDLTGGSGFDVFIFKKGEANGDEIMDFDGNGNSAGDSIRLEGYAAGTTFTKVSGDTWKINDHGFVEFVTIHAAEPVKTSDWVVVP